MRFFPQLLSLLLVIEGAHCFLSPSPLLLPRRQIGRHCLSSHDEAGSGGQGRGGITGWHSRSNVGGGSEDENLKGGGQGKGSMVLGGGLVVARGRYGSRSRKSSMSGNKLVTQFLIAVNVLAFLLQSVSGGALTSAGAMIKYNILSQSQYYRLITPIFLHGSVSHLLVNSFSLDAVGPQVESIYGIDRFTLVYLLSGVCGNVASCVLGSHASVGASGSIFGLVGCLAVFYARHEQLLGVSGKQALGGMAQTIVLNLALGLRPGSNIDNWGHLGGLVGGAAAGFMFGPRYKMRVVNYDRVLVDDPIISLPWSKKKLATAN